jgi:PAS domain S-box-containing protein
MSDGKPTYEELEARLAAAEAVIEALPTQRTMARESAVFHDQAGQVNGIFGSGENGIERMRAEKALQAQAHDEGERAGEEDHLPDASSVITVPRIMLEEIVQGIVDLIPLAWQYPEAACARIVLEGQEFRTENFAYTPWQQAADIVVHGRQSGTVQVGYLQQRPASDEGPFLKQERSMLNAIAGRVAKITERIRAEEQVLQEHRFLQVVLDSLAHPFYVINAQDHTVELANSAAYEGRFRGERTCFTLVHGRDQPCEAGGELCPLHEVLRTKRPVTVEHVHLDEHGRPRDVEVRGYPIIDPEGNVVRMIEYTLDITERKETEQALREAEARWRSLTETSPDHIITLDTDLRIQFVNSALPGLTTDELIGVPLYTLVDEEGQAEIKAVLEKVLRTGTPARYETVYHVPDGGDIYYESHVATRVLPGIDEPVGLTLSARDVTERKQAEQALRDSEEKLRALFEILPIGISVLDDSRNILLANPALAHVLRLSPDQLRSGEYGRRTYLRADGTEMSSDEFPSTRALREQRPIRDVQIGVAKEDGELIWTSVSAGPLPFTDWRLILATVDITDQKRAEAELVQAQDELELRVKERTAELVELTESLRLEIAVRRSVEEDLRASEERFRQLAEHTDNVVWLAEPDTGRLLYLSPAYQTVWGRSLQSPPETVGHLWADVHPEDLELLPRDLMEAWVGQEIECRLVAPDSQVRWIRVRAYPVRDEAGQIYRLVGIVSDITEQKHTQTTLIEAERLAIAGRMAASLAHEISNPLQAAIGCLDLGLEKLDKGEDALHHLEVTAQALERATRVVAQLRALHYRVDAEGKEARDLNELLENALTLVQKRCIDQRVEVIWQPTPDLPPVLLMPDAMQQVFLNLLLNALDAMQQGGRLQVSTSQSQEPPSILIRFSDTGPGIPRDRLECVFQPFYSTKSTGLGLGLFISHSIVQQHGGDIEVYSHEGEGTTFSIWLPFPREGVD